MKKLHKNFSFKVKNQTVEAMCNGFGQAACGSGSCWSRCTGDDYIALGVTESYQMSVQ